MKKILLVLVLLVTACSSAASYTPGTYTITVDGHNGPLETTVLISEDGAIEQITLNHEESVDHIPEVAQAVESIPAAIVDKQSTDVDVVSGATVTSNAIIEAVDLALEEASK